MPDSYFQGHQMYAATNANASRPDRAIRKAIERAARFYAFFVNEVAKTSKAALHQGK